MGLCVLKANTIPLKYWKEAWVYRIIGGWSNLTSHLI